MKTHNRLALLVCCTLMIIIIVQCLSDKNNKSAKNKIVLPDSCTILVQAEDFIASQADTPVKVYKNSEGFVKTTGGGWLEYKISIPAAGRYNICLFAQTSDTSKVNCWIEDYVDNKDGRTYNITGNMVLQRGLENTNLQMVEKMGSPLDTGLHNIRIHCDSGAVILDKICFSLIKPHKNSTKVMRQQTTGKKWGLVWSDEFDGQGLPDTTKWTFDIGNWGWGNNELQYYTDKKVENARQEDGKLIIEARKNDSGLPWSSARLTTRGKESFLYGKIEFRAKVPVGRGTWSAGWLLGDEYRDELSWPYCGEIDVLENVGFELDGNSGDGKTHASIHCGAYYFKLGNQPTSITVVENMNNTFHTYTLEWFPDSMNIYVDGNKYFNYHDASSNLSWPFSKPQNIILNLAIGGGWGGAKGVDPSISSQKFVIDYVRVYALQ
ncbi:MAG: family 16 glycosylhydrolase [Bacteroidota bacterium]